MLRLALLFKLINSRPADAIENRFFIACEIFSNLDMIRDFKLLDIVDLGDRGRDYYAGLAEIALNQKATWQTYAAAVYFDVPRCWITVIAKDDKLPGKLGKSLEATQRNV